MTSAWEDFARWKAIYEMCRWPKRLGSFDVTPWTICGFCSLQPRLGPSSMVSVKPLLPSEPAMLPPKLFRLVRGDFTTCDSAPLVHPFRFFFCLLYLQWFLLTTTSLVQVNTFLVHILVPILSPPPPPPPANEAIW